MVKTGDTLKVFYPNIIHVTCVAHMLNRVVEKSPSRIQLYKEMLPGLPLPPEPVITRWGTWIEAVIFNTNNYEGIKSVIEKLDNDSSASVDNCKKIFKLPTVKNDLTFIKINFSGLIRAITNLEDTKLTLLQSLGITKIIISELSNIQGDKGSIIKNKISQLYQKNKGFQLLEQIGLIISGNNEIQIPENFNPCFVANMKYAPLTSVDVERSFSLYKHILINDILEFIDESNKEKRIWVREWIKRRTVLGASENLLTELALEDPEEYRLCLRMTTENFEQLLNLVSPTIQKQDTILRDALLARIKLQITLNYLATGNSYRTLQHFFRVSIPAISKFLPEVCDAIYKAMEQYINVGIFL
ncbi:hypothetical protein QTP88_001819 [Uroleucon formosanum]